MGGLHALQWPRGHEGDGASLPALDLRDLAHELRIAVHRADDGRGRGAKWEVPGGWDGLQARGEPEGHRRDRLHDRGPEGAADRGLEILEQGAEVRGTSAPSEWHACMLRGSSVHNNTVCGLFRMYRILPACFVQSIFVQAKSPRYSALASPRRWHPAAPLEGAWALIQSLSGSPSHLSHECAHCSTDDVQGHGSHSEK